ncbi:MAG: type IX secretion system membrane protein PorP/SprF [Bacteroidales bacterium]|nr:type IX secretion system membrane protein PorP/SprF [Bacteroidales bacterium]
MKNVITTKIFPAGGLQDVNEDLKFIRIIELFRTKTVIISAILTVLLMPLASCTQDPVFSQFYGNPLYLNPALAGSGECPRFIANYRNQWPSMPGNFVTYSASFDLFSEPLSGGLGMLVTSDNTAGSIFVTHRISLIYSHHLTINANSFFNAGFEATLHQQTFNWDKLIFPDMIDENTGNISNNTGEPPPGRKSVIVPDFSTGFLYSHSNGLYAGLAAHHLNRPDLDFYRNSAGNPLYIKYTAHAGKKITLSERSVGHSSWSLSLSPNMLYQHQRNANSLSAGFYLERSPLTAGFWYRHTFENPDGMIFLLGIKQKRFTFGYSYDLTLSKLRAATGGAHEVSFGMLVFCEKRNRKGAIKCPEF